jgi:hypothetical protein
MLAKFTDISRQVYFSFATRCFCCLLPEMYGSGIVRTHMGTHKKSENGRSCMGRFARYHPVIVTNNQ